MLALLIVFNIVVHSTAAVLVIIREHSVATRVTKVLTSR